MASLAITFGLQNYYQNFITPIQDNLGYIGDIITGSFLPVVTFSDYIIPGLHLAEFFVVAFPIVHSLYIFLSSIKIEEIKDSQNGKGLWHIWIMQNSPLALVVIFGISITQVPFLYFLGGSIAQADLITPLIQNDSIIQEQVSRTPEEYDDFGMNSTRYKDFRATQLAQSNAFLFWLTLTIVTVTVGSIAVRVNIGVPQRKRIPWEWIMLYAFTLGFLISISLTIFRLQLFNDLSQLYDFHIMLLSVLISRAVLDYIIGRRIYFPESYPEST